MISLISRSESSFVTYQCNINIQMYCPQKPRYFEYTSLTIGSKNLTTVVFPRRRIPSILNTKGCPKKANVINYKYKQKDNKKKMSRERPGIFLEGEQFAKITNSQHNCLDFSYIQFIKQKMRKSTPCNVDKGRALEATLKVDTPEKIDLNKTQLFQEQKISKTSHFKTERKTTNFGNQDHPKSSCNRDPKYKGSRKNYTTERPIIAQRETKQLQRETKYLHKESKLSIEKKIIPKLDPRQQQTVTTHEQFKRKQLFYLAQKDLSNIRSQSFIVVQHPSGQIITGYYFKKVVEIASLTKIMTFYTVIHLISKYSLTPQQIILKIDDHSAETSGTSAELYEGDTYTVKQLLYALMLPSGNDAAVALAHWGGSLLGEGTKDFVLLMNRLASQIGMKSSTFGNPHGLPHPQNGSTAEDLSKLVRKCLEHQIFRQVISCKQFKCWTQNEGVKREVIWQNTNKLLRRPGFAGVKTGVTVTAGPCLASFYRCQGRQFIVILLRTSKLSRRFKQTRWILSMCLKRLNYDGQLSTALRELSREDPELDSDNSQEEEPFNFYRNDLFQFQRRRKILLNQM